ncbi:hypothetical protein PR048_019840 [Dryococelus australis]|uniref:Uncharacterized protein n=1 Tax=Dryococelus australis TaxID=614101 RepID=A0ABQ9H4P3_9NEOP|nr:hypothetical protein PR048_019840 [Dryococelus australis]
MKGRGKRETSEKTRRPTASSDMIPTCEISGVTRPGIELGSPWWKASRLTAQSSLLDDTLFAFSAAEEMKSKRAAKILRFAAIWPPSKVSSMRRAINANPSGATVASHVGETGSIPARVIGFSHVGIEADDTVVGGFSWGSPVFPALSFRCCPILTSISLFGSQDLAETIFHVPPHPAMADNCGAEGISAVRHLMAAPEAASPANCSPAVRAQCKIMTFGYASSCNLVNMPEV